MAMTCALAGGGGYTHSLPSWCCRPPRCSIVSAESVGSRLASRALTRRPRPEGWQLSRRTGEEQGTEISAGRTTVRRAISVPLTPVTKGLSRTFTDGPSRRSGGMAAQTAQIPKLTAWPSL